MQPRWRNLSARHGSFGSRTAVRASSADLPVYPVPLVNPFAAMGLESSDRETPTATFAELQAFRAKAVELRLQSLATAALIGWEWLQRETDIFATFDVMHYRPKEHPNAVRVVHEKTREEIGFPCSMTRACRSTRS
jgi:hypothetical protein